MAHLLNPAVLLQVIVGGVLLGGIYALIAAGLNLLFGVLKIINLAHGEFMMLGAYATFFLFASAHLHPVLSLLITMPATFLLGLIVHRLVIRRITGSPELITLLVTFGLSILIVNLALQLWSADFRSVPYLSGSLSLGPLAVSRSRLVAFLTAVSISLVIGAFLRYGSLGKAVRATAQHAEVAQTCGIDIDRIRILTFGLGSAMAGAAGSLLITIFSVDPTMGHRFMLKAFAVCVIGGLGSFPGALLGGLLLGVAESTVSLALTSQHADAVAYVLLILVLLVRPSGLLGVKA